MTKALTSESWMDMSGPVKAREIVKIIQDDGWFLARTRGSHRQFHHSTKRGTVTVAGGANDDLPKKTLQSILKQAGLR